MKKVVVGISGGVDSSVAALLLKKQGYDVIGLFMRNWDTSLNGDFLGNPDIDNNICPQEQDYNDAKEVCNKLDIPLYRIDFVKEYWDYVFTYFLDELKKGRTPNPDIMCNKYIKFDMFLSEAEKLGADFVATGHYARLKDGKLMRGIDDNKDQTYFLSQVSKEKLKKILFPVGDLKKEEVRKIALEYDLITAKKKDSTGICFIGKRNFFEFLQNYIPNKPGKIIDINSKKILGKHLGTMYYTIGQNKNLHLAGQNQKYYVCKKDVSKNYLYVCQQNKKNKYLMSNKCLIKDFNFINNYSSKNKSKFLKVRFRHLQKLNKVLSFMKIKKDNYWTLRYVNTLAVTPGQYAVIYDRNICIGGGKIEKVYEN